MTHVPLPITASGLQVCGGESSGRQRKAGSLWGIMGPRPEREAQGINWHLGLALSEASGDPTAGWRGRTPSRVWYPGGWRADAGAEGRKEVER